MSEEIRKKGKCFSEALSELSEDDIQKRNDTLFKRIEEEHARFKEKFDLGLCYLCNKELNSFSKKRPCIHWFLKPKGFKKKDLLAVAGSYGLLQIENVLRWYANEDAFAKNINDLTEEGTNTKVVELTIRFNKLEWSFSCAESDYLGHQKSQHSKYPHYHFQMRVDKRPFINFNDFHLPLHETDIINMEANRSMPRLIKKRNFFGEGMSDVFNESVIDDVMNNASSEDNPDEGVFSIDSLAFAEDGKKISGDDLYQIMEEAKSKGVTIASLIHKLPNANTEVMVSPGSGVVEQAPRTGRKK